MNELLYESAGGGTAANADLFSKSDGAVRFFELLV